MRGLKNYVYGVFLFALLLPAPAAARWEFEGGMEYFTVQVYIRDPDGFYFQNLIQSTLGKAAAGWIGGPLEMRISAGLSDWNVSGEWRSSYFEPMNTEALYTWVWQQQVQGEIICRVLGNLGIGADFYDHDLRQHLGDYSGTYLRYRTRAMEVLLDYPVLMDKGLQIGVKAAYAPWARLEMYHNSPLIEVDNKLGELDTAGPGKSWRGNFHLQYRDAANWGLDLIYALGYARFPQPRGLDEVSLRFGSLTGYFVLWF